MISELENKIFSLKTDEDFFDCCLDVYNYQYTHNAFYKLYVDSLPSFKNKKITSVIDFPFLPIQFFKTQQIISTPVSNPVVFQSSGTTSEIAGKHYLSDVKIYERSFLKNFEKHYGNIKGKCIIGLLPSYLERGNSSLIYMVQKLIELSKHPKSGFCIRPHQELVDYLHESTDEKILFGVTYALLDFAEQNIALKNTIVIETGGMKGKGKELTRNALHDKLHHSFRCTIHSEYGMTELLSQSYLGRDVSSFLSIESSAFSSPSWKRVLTRNLNDPFDVKTEGKGVLNIIDLANLHSCSFIATDDLGQVFTDKTFEVNGRLDNADLRGCNLLV